MMEQMTKNELKTGMHVVTRDGNEYVLFKDTTFGSDFMVTVNENDASFWSPLNSYNDNLTSEVDSDLDIVRVYVPHYQHNVIEYKYDTQTDKDSVSTLIFAEETMTRKEAEQKFGIRIVD